MSCFDAAAAAAAVSQQLSLLLDNGVNVDLTSGTMIT